MSLEAITIQLEPADRQQLLDTLELKILASRYSRYGIDTSTLNEPALFILARAKLKQHITVDKTPQPPHAEHVDSGPLP